MSRSLLIWLASGWLGLLPLGGQVRGAETARRESPVAATVCTEWSETQRRADPNGYFQFVREKLEQENAELTPACEAVKQDIARQNTAIQAKADLWRKAKEIAEKARESYQRAEKDGCWPVELCGVSYCKEQLQSQVSMLMEEAKGLAECVTKMKATCERSEAKLEELTVRKNRVDSQVSVCTTLHELWKVSRLRSDGERMLACLNELIPEEPLQLADCQSQTADSFPAIPTGVPEPHRDFSQVARFLQNAPVKAEVRPAVQQQQTSVPAGKGGKKPIFAQK